MIANVIIPSPLQPLSYKIPKQLKGKLSIGDSVFIPLRKKEVSGYISEFILDPKDPPVKIKSIIGVNPRLPNLSEEFLHFLQWISLYYHYPIGEVLRCAIPSETKLKKRKIYSLNPDVQKLKEKSLKAKGKRLDFINHLEKKGTIDSVPLEYKNTFTRLKKEGFIRTQEVEADLQFLQRKKFPQRKAIIQLSKEQNHACKKIYAAIESNTYKPFLLHGITGSGKTEVYLSAAQYALAQGKSTIILVPEISLTPQLLSRAQARLGNNIAVLHSELSKSERTTQWNLIYRGTARIVLGARSTIFAPMKNIGLIVVDEEHETAFKQEDHLRYSARDMALVRAKQANSTVILGSATPSLESYYHSLTGKLETLSLQSRPTKGNLPQVEVIDLRREESNLSGRLIKKIKETLGRKKQIILLLNRKGFASFLFCESCGFVPECPNCSVSLTSYRKIPKLQCHYCSYTCPQATACKKCSHSPLSDGTPGTESLETELKALFPQARVLRLDRSATNKHGALEEKLVAIAQQKFDIIVGTQIIAKGHDFPHVELVAVVNADLSLNIADFRAAERCFQLLTQVAGRAGRGDSRGSVLIQTYSPSHPSIQYTQKHSYHGFAKEELEKRLLFQYPPYIRIARILVSDTVNSRAQQSIDKIFRSLCILKKEKEIELLGPAIATLNKIQKKYRWNILLKSKNAPHINAVLNSGLPYWRKSCHKSTQISIDIDPTSFF